MRGLTEEGCVWTGKLKKRHSVDHIAISEEAFSNLTCEVDAWEGTDSDGTQLSDHNGVAVCLFPKIAD